jgi:hypothetical protein
VTRKGGRPSLFGVGQNENPGLKRGYTLALNTSCMSWEVFHNFHRKWLFTQQNQ